ncbi:hypothetical protein SO802_031450 [Lithocarpus litseifolius]|uniref:RNase H type-1 domain-containing protein n=1 Tax=Lithocarpus litseifolius TaxID=425828 RepID=A0AAW2BKH5_9ROSI
MQNLSHKGIHCSGFCPLRDKAIKTTAHALLHCDHAKMTWAFWHNCPIDFSSPNCDLVDIALDIIAKGSPNDLELFFAVAWSIWWNRNQAIHENSGSPPLQAWDMASKIMAEFKAACSYPILPQAPPLSIWKAPPLGFFKVNTDATASNDERNSCIGVVIRGCKGEILAASSKVLPASFTAEISEVFAVLEGVMLAAKMEVTHVMFESDALSIIQAINDGVFVGELGHIIQNIWEASSVFSWCSFCHLKGKATELLMNLQE